ncbi:hypothetical protein Zmor_024399 [Zophobas morio]|uniref:Endonuclease/exonuclease/phosphatase domain-containing protein n=1 Tax=Zophobas morio TaxID=2755281 RepID=A0AA38I510_9CUCU|nr:hypothetical protein Zmor_024399 [Zophobas morio]
MCFFCDKECESERRGWELEELIGELDLEVLNRPSDLFTFSGPMAEPDIDVTVVNGGWLERFVCDTWEVKEDWGVSDHNCISINPSVCKVCGGSSKCRKMRRGWSMGMRCKC